MDKKAMTFKEKLALYIDARLPILYVGRLYNEVEQLIKK